MRLQELGKLVDILLRTARRPTLLSLGQLDDLVEPRGGIRGGIIGDPHRVALRAVGADGDPIHEVRGGQEHIGPAELHAGGRHDHSPVSVLFDAGEFDAHKQVGQVLSVCGVTQQRADSENLLAGSEQGAVTILLSETLDHHSSPIFASPSPKTGWDVGTRY